MCSLGGEGHGTFWLEGREVGGGWGEVAGVAREAEGPEAGRGESGGDGEGEGVETGAEGRRKARGKRGRRMGGKERNV